MATGLRFRLRSRIAKQDTSLVEPNEGTVAGDLRVLVTRTGDYPFNMAIVSAFHTAFAGAGWKVTVSPADSNDVIAEQRFRRRRMAERTRDEFVRIATRHALDRTDAERIRRMLRN